MRVFESLNCILCKNPFARVANQPRSPVQLACGLAMCHECFGKEAKTDQKERKHQCGERTCFKNANYAYFLIDVLAQENALVFTPMGYVLLKPFKIPNVRFVVILRTLISTNRKIDFMDIAEEMFYCGECGFEICGTCAYKKHHPHKAIPLLEKQANQMLKGLQQESKNVIETYKNLVPELHKELLEDIDGFETKLLSKEGILKEASTFADLRQKHESFTKIELTFESYAEGYLRDARQFDTRVKRLIETLNETLDV